MNSFEAVVRRYNNTKPIISNLHTAEHDIRPVGDRRRKWERIIKLSDTKYALVDGHYDPYVGWYASSNNPDIAKRRSMFVEDHVEAVAAFVWEIGRKYETLTIRNAPNSQALSRYNFLQEHLPYPHMRMVFGNGKQYISVNGTQYYLPHTQYAGWRDWEQGPTKASDLFLRFRREIGGTEWTLISGEHTEYTRSTRVDTSQKAKLKPYIQALYPQLLALGNMLPRTTFVDEYTTFNNHHFQRPDRSAIHAFIVGQNEVVSAYAKEHTLTYNVYAYNKLYRLQTFFEENSELSQAIITDDTHPLRLAFITTLWYSKNIDELDLADSDEFKKAKARLNSGINKLCGLVSNVTIRKNTNQ